MWTLDKHHPVLWAEMVGRKGGEQCNLGSKGFCGWAESEAQ